MSKAIYKTVIYCRLSKEDGDKLESNSIGGQRSYCLDYISKQNDMQIVHEPIIDDGFSGISLDRPGFKLLESELRKGTINCIVVKDFSRISRNYIDSGRYLEKIFPSMGVRFVAINDNYDSLHKNEHSDSYMLPFKSLINDTYCKDISVKVRSSLEIKKKNGEFVSNFCPYGYKRCDENKYLLEIDEEAAEIVRTIFTLFKDGTSILNISRRLNDLAIPTPMDYKRANGINFQTAFKIKPCSLWEYKTVKRILNNEVYMGMLIQGKRGRVNYKLRDVILKDEKEWFVCENCHEPLITYADFMAIQEMLKRDMCTSADNTLSGFLYCGDCNCAMVKKTVTAGKKKYIYYICSNYKKHKKCSSHSTIKSKIDELLFNVLHNQIELVINLEKMLDFINTDTSMDRQLLNYETQISNLLEEIERYKTLKLGLYEDMTSKIITEDDFLDFKNRYNNLINEKQNAIKRLEKECETLRVNGNTIGNWISIFKEYENIEELNRRVLMALVDRVFIYENKAIEISFKYADEFSQLNTYISENLNTENFQDILVQLIKVNSKIKKNQSVLF